MTTLASEIPYNGHDTLTLHEDAPGDYVVIHF